MVLAGAWCLNSSSDSNASEPSSPGSKLTAKTPQRSPARLCIHAAGSCQASVSPAPGWGGFGALLRLQSEQVCLQSFRIFNPLKDGFKIS